MNANQTISSNLFSTPGFAISKSTNYSPMKSPIPALIILLMVSILLGSCSSGSDTPKEQASDVSSANEATLTDEQTKILNIALGKIETRTLSQTIKVNGMLDVPPQNMVTISAPLGGFVKHTELLQGMRVRKGQVLAMMEDPAYIQLQQDYIDSKSQLEFLELEYTRQQQLAAENVNAAKTLQQAKSNYISTKAKVEGLRSKLHLIHLSPEEIEKGEIKSTIAIISPISGYVTQVHVNIGMYVHPADVMFKIVDTEHLHAEAQVFEKDLAQLKVGQHVLLTLAHESRPRSANVYLIGKEISPERTVRVHCHLDKEDPDLIPGMYFTALIETSERSVLAVTENAIVSFEGAEYIFLQKGKNHFVSFMVKSGVTENGFTEVSLPEGTDISAPLVTEGAYALLGKLKNVEE